MKPIQSAIILAGAVLAGFCTIAQAEVVASWDFTQAADQLVDTTGNGHNLTNTGVTFDTSLGAQFSAGITSFLAYDAAALNPLNAGAANTWLLTITGLKFNTNPVGSTYHTPWGQRLPSGHPDNPAANSNNGLFIYKYKNEPTNSARSNHWEAWHYDSSSSFVTTTGNIANSDPATIYNLSLAYEPYSGTLTFGVQENGGEWAYFSKTVDVGNLHILGDEFQFGSTQQYPTLGLDGSIASASIDISPLPDPRLEIADTFTFQNNGAAETLSLPFTNAGITQNLTITSAEPDALNTEFGSATFDSPVLPEESGTIEVPFTPTGGSAYDTILTIVSNDSAIPSREVAISVEVFDPQISVPTTTLDFGTFSPSPGPQTASLTISNTGGTQALTIAATSETSDPGYFNVTTTLPLVIPVGGSANIEVEFTPGADEGSFNALLYIDSNDASKPTVEVTLTALIGTPMLVVLDQDNALGQSWLTAAAWSDDTAPSPLNNYLVDPAHPDSSGAYLIRTPETTADIAFPGKSLTMNAGSIMGLKLGNTTVTFGDLRVNGGSIWQSTSRAGSIADLAGQVLIESGGFFLGNNGNGLVISAELSGTGAITLDSAGNLDNHLSITNSASPWSGNLGIYDSTVSFDYDLGAGDLVIQVETVAEIDGGSVTSDPTLDLAGRTLTFNSFIMDNVAIAAGTYVAADFSDGIIDSVGGGQLIIQNTAVVVGGFISWAAGYGIPADENDDSDHDGIPALMEYGIGYNPTLAETLPVPVPTGGGEYSLTWPKGAEAAVDPKISYTVEVSPDLVTWGAAAAPNSLAETATELVLTLGADQDKVFARLIVTRTP